METDLTPARSIGAIVAAIVEGLGRQGALGGGVNTIPLAAFNDVSAAELECVGAPAHRSEPVQGRSPLSHRIQITRELGEKVDYLQIEFIGFRGSDLDETAWVVARVDACFRLDFTFIQPLEFQRQAKLINDEEFDGVDAACTNLASEAAIRARASVTHTQSQIANLPITHDASPMVNEGVAVGTNPTGAVKTSVRPRADARSATLWGESGWPLTTLTFARSLTGAFPNSGAIRSTSLRSAETVKSMCACRGMKPGKWRARSSSCWTATTESELSPCPDIRLPGLQR